MTVLLSSPSHRTMSCLSSTLTTPVTLAFSDWQAHPPLLETWPSLQSELSETPITAPSPPARPSLATDSGGQCLTGSPPLAALPRSTCTQPPSLEKLIHSAPPASPCLASSCALDSPGNVLSVMPDPGTERLGHTVHQVHCGPFPHQSLGRSASWEWCVCRLDPLQPPCCKIPLESDTCSPHSPPVDTLHCPSFPFSGHRSSGKGLRRPCQSHS